MTEPNSKFEHMTWAERMNFILAHCKCSDQYKDYAVKDPNCSVHDIYDEVLAVLEETP